ncbi:WW domain-containing adapter protein with coiled-coil homolog [Drosophila subpulchrella]|uniref:WW domain-containing adapter protein with coiled-coil homolog n=1 Tax=Drosophila subpulchrella TaxID=1486046 RepID=UPI0018A147DB|nr:WW domain-containing adapter protein with coiled-coil homolog [Drosophila subpulchrella]
MAGFLKTRKRSREDDLPCESTPLSKRINNLHLNYDDGNSSSSSSCSIPPLPGGGGGGAAAGAPGGGPGGPGGPDAAGYEYNPELGADQNPFYYEKNKMLYDLHVERIKRSSQ